jgi:hypothetical protein
MMNVTGEWLAVLAALGVALPMLQSLIQKSWWSSRVKAAISLGMSILAAAIAYIVQNGFSFHNWPTFLTWLVGVFTAVVVGYHGLMRPLGLAPAVEAATSNGPNVVEAVDGPDTESDGTENVPYGSYDTDGFTDTSHPENVPDTPEPENEVGL